ncbi:hypothetical protein PLESTF_001831400 [Pleodorina starrii]|nr:hypothetical protein PLESTF_001831400 [Pleodorina starrii]
MMWVWVSQGVGSRPSFVREAVCERKKTKTSPQGGRRRRRCLRAGPAMTRGQGQTGQGQWQHFLHQTAAEARACVCVSARVCVCVCVVRQTKPHVPVQSWTL